MEWLPFSKNYLALKKAAKVNPAYCDCLYHSFVYNASDLFRLTKCRCGEDVQNVSDFAWNFYVDKEGDDDVRIEGNNMAVHPIYTNGTVIMKGNKSLEIGMIHYWELKIITPLHGRDMMIGVGTDAVDIDHYRNTFNSPLGLTSNSWGYSYKGRFQHDGVFTPYGRKFTNGYIIGVYVDRSQGYIEYYLNRKPLGVASRTIPVDPNVQLYPMISCTLDRTVIRLISCVSVKDSLEYRAMQAAAKSKDCLKIIQEFNGIKKICSKYWFLAPSVCANTNANKPKDKDVDEIDQAVLGNKKSLKRKAHHPEITGNSIKELNELLSAQQKKKLSTFFNKCYGDSFLRKRHLNITNDSIKIIPFE